MGNHPFLDAAPLAFAHRGGDEAAPENTARAFQAAVDLGFRHLETDVHLSADGTLVAFHDAVLDRLTDASGPLSSRSTAELRSVRIAGTDPIPTFDELLGSFPDAFWNVDPKSDDALAALAAAIRRHAAVDRVNVAAFSDARLQRIRRVLGPRASTAAGPREVAALVAASQVPAIRRRVARVPYTCVQVPVRHRRVRLVTRAFIDAAHARGAQVHVWTIDEPEEMHRLLDLGVDGIMTDRPSVLREVMTARGVWS